MSGGRIVIKGNAGHLVGSAVRGANSGIRGGEIIVHGSAGNEVGSGMRRGLIAIGGDCGDFAGVNMIAGSVIVLGRLGWRAGAGLKRGSIVSMHEAELLPTFSYACTYSPGFLRLYLYHLREVGLMVEDQYLTGRYQRWSGDAVESNRGEILLYDR
jgi:formylmethanofuran dehydrogenase subunit C